MQKLTKQVTKGKTKEVQYEYDQQIAENLADCLQICNGDERAVVSFFNDAYGRHLKAKMKPRPSIKRQHLVKWRQTLSPEVRVHIKSLSEEEQYEILKQAEEKVKLHKPGKNT